MSERVLSKPRLFSVLQFPPFFFLLVSRFICFIKQPANNYKKIDCLLIAFSISCVPYLSFPLPFPRAQEIFRQAMRSSVVRLEVVPVFNKERFEKSVISHLFNPESSDASAWTKEPPPLKVKPTVRPVESSSGWQAEFQESNSSLESRSLGSPLPISLSPTPRGKSSETSLLKNSLGPSPLQNHNKKGGKRLRIDLKKGKQLGNIYWKKEKVKICVSAYIFEKRKICS